ncbi:MAG: asparagine synthase C-terminal domain-containing protein, partial [Bdellovibrionales bacterium]|nr:asparagine synthase C-terminal domain-containing protein [Bdellovibrionales bacterium]
VPVNYWRVNLNYRSKLSYEKAANKLRDLFLESIALHLRSDVPVGAALSGGIDSSAIVCAIRCLEPNKEIHTFTYVADDKSVSEEKWADIVIDHVGAIPHKVKANPTELVKDLDYLIAIQGEPFGSTSIYAQHKVFQIAKESGIKVMLDGQGADELLAGYTGYAGARIASLLWQLKLKEAYSFIEQASQWPGRSRKMLTKRALNYFVPTQLQPFARKLVGREVVSDWIDAQWFRKRDVRLVLPNWKNYGKDCLRQELLRSLESVSVPSLLRYEDRNSMAHSIESRVPFLNRPLVEFLFSLPEEYLIDANGKSKAIFRSAMRGIVPDKILDRRDKIGFATPEQKWLSQNRSWVQSSLNKAEKEPMFYYPALEKEWQAVLDGKKPFGWHIWRCINYLRWAELFKVEKTSGNSL